MYDPRGLGCGLDICSLYATWCWVHWFVNRRTCHMVDLNVQLRLRLQAVQTLWPLDFGGVTARPILAIQLLHLRAQKASRLASSWRSGCPHVLPSSISCMTSTCSTSEVSLS